MQADQGRNAEAERRTAVAGMRAALPLETAANQQRQQQLQEVQERVAKLRVSEWRLLSLDVGCTGALVASSATCAPGGASSTFSEG